MQKVNKYLLASLILFQGYLSFAQKPAIDTGVLSKWPEIKSPKISNDGKYVLYLEHYNEPGQSILHIKSVNTGQELVRTNIDEASSYSISFSADSRKTVFLTKGDSLNILDLQKSVSQLIPQVQSFQVAPAGHWAAWLTKDDTKVLRVSDLNISRNYEYDHVTQYWFSPNGSALVFVSTTAADANRDKVSLTWLDLSTRKSTIIWKGEAFSNRYTFDHSGNQLAFTGTDNNLSNGKVLLWWFKAGMTEAKIIAGDHNHQLDETFEVANKIPYFSTNNDKLLFNVKKAQVDIDATNKHYNNVRILNATEDHIRDRSAAVTYWAITGFNTGKACLLNRDGAELMFREEYNFEKCLLFTTGNDRKFWLHRGQHTYGITDLESGVRKDLIIKTASLFLTTIELSQDQRYVVWFDPDSLSYFSYEIATGRTRNISSSVPQQLYCPSSKQSPDWLPWGVADYDRDGHNVYLYDQYDIWKLDLDGLNAPVNITNGYGRKHHITFSLPNELFGDIGAGRRTINKDQRLILSAFAPQTKQNGFWHLDQPAHDPQKDCMDDHCYEINRTGMQLWDEDERPEYTPIIKAGNANVYLVSRQAAAEFPNLYVTADFSHFAAISDLHPEKTYNWLTTELVNWKTVDGEPLQGVLYKPENFDPSKKYPVIFTYYNLWSDDLHEYCEPDWSRGRIDIPYFVSNGYLVFAPDISYHFQQYTKGTTDAILSAANYLSKLPFVDPAKMGLQGHSYGGYETNVAVTHTKNIFAAACTAAGVSDLVSSDFLPDIDQRSETGQIYLGPGVTPWANPDIYMRNSPIFNIQEATTPLLIVHGDEDHAVPYEQAVEMYHAMRRANKTCWLLTYHNASHILFNNDARDFTVRVKQFFDYYLKGMPPPIWMTSTINDGKPVSTSLEPDNSGKRP